MKEEEYSPDSGLVSSIFHQKHRLRVHSSIILTNLQAAHPKPVFKIQVPSPIRH